jgi:selenocysteine lyase/cysteine desulfurase
MKLQKHLFQLPPDIHYLNCAYMSPLLRSVEEKGAAGLAIKRDPSRVVSQDFFTEVDVLRESFGALIGATGQQCAVIPSASYGLMAAVNNVPYSPGKHAITISKEFPSGYFSLQRWCSEHGAELRVIQPDQALVKKGRLWNQLLLEAINKDTAMVLISAIHWMDGTIFDLAQIGQRCKEVGARFIVDGSQSVGALPIDVKACQIDALITVTYKWMMGPYSMGLAYYNEVFNDGTPLEESWMNRSNAVDFSKLTDYEDAYRPGAGRYQVGQTSNFIAVPMMIEAIRQIKAWQVSEIQAHGQELLQPLLTYLQNKGVELEEDAYLAKHLTGLRLPQGIDSQTLLARLKERKIFLSLRGSSIRLAPHVYNDAADIQRVLETIDSFSV